MEDARDDTRKKVDLLAEMAWRVPFLA